MRSSLASRFVASPNHDERVGPLVDALVLHYTGMPNADGALARLCDPEAKVSSHYLVYENGEIVQLVSEARRAWHAGVSSWQDAHDLNSRSIGIEIANPGHDGGLPPFPVTQIDAVIRLCRDIMQRWPIPPERVLAHSDIAPTRKEDPGELFPWRQLAAAGVCIWVPPNPAGVRAQCADDGERSEFLHGLRAYGYGLTLGGMDDNSQAVIAAFQRRFRPERVDGVADPSTIATLQRLFKAETPSATDQ